MWPKLSLVWQMEKLLSDSKDYPFPSIHTGKTKDYHKYKSYVVCLLTCVYKQCSWSVALLKTCVGYSSVVSKKEVSLHLTEK